MLKKLIEKFNTKKEYKIEFLDMEQLKYLINPLNDNSLSIFSELIDRYVDAKMKEVVKDRIGLNKPIGFEETELRGVLGFKEFFNELYQQRKGQQ